HDNTTQYDLAPRTSEQTPDQDCYHGRRDNESQGAEQKRIAKAVHNHQGNARISPWGIGWGLKLALDHQPEPAQANTKRQQEGKGTWAHRFVGKWGFDAPPEPDHERREDDRGNTQITVSHGLLFDQTKGVGKLGVSLDTLLDIRIKLAAVHAE